MLGIDFRRAFSAWLYPTEKMQGFWRSVLLAGLLFVIYNVLQLIISFVIFRFGLHGDLTALANSMATAAQAGAGTTEALAQSAEGVSLAKALILSIFPAAVVMAFLCFYWAQFGLAGRAGRLPLAWPKLGPLGWLLLVAGFIALMILAGTLLALALGIDPSVYETSAKGLNDAKSQAGLVEKTLADLAKDPLLFALALPSVAIGAPLAEELIFRGFLFAGLVQTPLGRVGAVVITAALWSIVHAGPAPWFFVGIIFVMGLFLGLLLLRFGSLWVTFACHMAWNAMVAVQTFNMGGHS